VLDIDHRADIYRRSLRRHEGPHIPEQAPCRAGSRHRPFGIKERIIQNGRWLLPQRQ
jgi:hypothetical protein